MKFRMLLSALLLAAGLVCVVGCGKKADANKKSEENKTAEKPVDDKQAAIAAFNEWKTAIVKGDAAKAKAVAVKMAAEKVDPLIRNLKNDAEFKKIFSGTKVVSCNVDGAKATLKVKNDKGEGEVTMVKEDGKWKVAELK